MPALPYWLFPGDDRPTEEIDDEIAEELQLHLDLLAEEQERRGLAPEEAKQKAAERFGDFNQLLRRCRREKQGDVPMLLRVQTVLLVVLIALVATAGWRMSYIPDPILNAQYMSQTSEALQAIQDELADMRSTSTSADPASPHGDTITLQVIDELGKPIQNAELTFTFTRNAGNALSGFNNSYSLATDKDGSHTTPLSFEGKILESVTAYAPGYVITGESLARPFKPAETLTLHLRREVKQRFKLVASPDASHLKSRLLSNVDVMPDRRFQFIQHGAAIGTVGPRLRTDKFGVVEMGAVAKGDTVTLTATQQNWRWMSEPIAITGATEPIQVEMRLQRSVAGEYRDGDVWSNSSP